METIRIRYRQDESVWVAESPDIENWLVLADSFGEVRTLAHEAAEFAMDGAPTSIIDEPYSQWVYAVATAVLGSVTAHVPRSGFAVAWEAIVTPVSAGREGEPGLTVPA